MFITIEKSVVTSQGETITEIEKAIPVYGDIEVVDETDAVWVFSVPTHADREEVQNKLTAKGLAAKVRHTAVCSAEGKR